MLEFLFGFIEKYIFLIFICVLVLGIASIYSKKIKYLFMTLLGLAAFYFMLLCLFRLGIGIESLYVWSSKYIYLFCRHLEQYLFFIVDREIIFMKLLKFVMVHGFENSILQFGCFLITLISICLAINVFSPYLRGFIFKKIEIKNKIIIKMKKIINTIKEKQPKFLLNLVIRC